jgi:hypothetical protein
MEIYKHLQYIEILLLHLNLLPFPITLQQINRIKSVLEELLFIFFSIRKPIPTKQDGFGLDLRKSIDNIDIYFSKRSVSSKNTLEKHLFTLRKVLQKYYTSLINTNEKLYLKFKFFVI